jgi:dTDP-4-dehydrorhamnose reductase
VKVLLFGANGQLGLELQRALAPLGELVVCTRAPSPLLVSGARQGNTTQALHANFLLPDTLPALIERVRPSLLVNAAAFTGVDAAEAGAQAQATAINATAPGVIARCAAQLGLPLLHFSTDYVLPGHGSQPQGEATATGPVNAYGHSKLAGEQLVRASSCQHLILRSSALHAAHGHNFVRTVLRLAAQHSSLQMVADQVGAPTSAALLADVTAQVAQHWLRSPATTQQLGGTYHCTASGSASWHEVATQVLLTAKDCGARLQLSADALQPINSAAYRLIHPHSAPRPLNSRLCCSKLQTAFGVALPSWQSGVQLTVNTILRG